MSSSFLLYGANGYTGALIAREAVKRGMRPLLAGRNAEAVGALARELSLESRAFSLDDSAALDAALRAVPFVLHAAGPFAHTYRAMVDACLRTGRHYVDITGEVEVFEGCAARDAEARAAGVLLLPGGGFDVVPSDCLAAHLHRRMPAAVRLALGFEAAGSMSRGTATTVVENLPRGGWIRSGGTLKPVPAAWSTRTIDFGAGPRTAVTIPWGDLSTAWHSTGIPAIEVYLAVSRGQRRAMVASRWFTWLLGTGPVQSYLKSRIRSGPAGPSEEARARGESLLWGEVADAEGRTAVSRLRTPEGYTLTALTAAAIAERIVSGKAPPGFQTPSRAYGADFILEIPGCRRTDA